MIDKDSLQNTLLNTLVKTLVSSIMDSWHFFKILIIPVFSGLYYKPLQSILSESTSGFLELPTPKVDVKAVEEISLDVFKKQGIPESLLFEDKKVYSSLKKAIGHPRTLEKVLEHIVWNCKQGRKQIVDFSLLDLKLNVDIKPDSAQILLAHVILGTVVQYSDLISEYDAKYWDVKGLCNLVKCEDGFQIVMSWYQFKGIVRILKDDVWNEFVRIIDECLEDPQSKLYGTSFERFKEQFDKILNKCFLYLEKKEVPVKERTDLELYFRPYIYGLVFSQ